MSIEHIIVGGVILALIAFIIYRRRRKGPGSTSGEGTGGSGASHPGQIPPRQQQK